MQATDFSVPLRTYLIEDDSDLREEMVFSLTELGFDAQGFGNAVDFYRAYALARCDVVVIDIGLPGEDGLTIASHLRASGPLGIVMVTARGQLDDRLEGMRSGADAYLVKPVHIEELAATLKALRRRIFSPALTSARLPAPQAVAAPSAGAWRLLESGWVLTDSLSQRMKLTTSERAFLGCLFARKGQAVSRDELIVALGGNVFDFDGHRVDAIASRLRRKAIRHGMELPLHAVRGTGYILSS